MYFWRCKMAYRSRVYKTTKLSDGRRIVSSSTAGEAIVMDIIKFCFKAVFYVCFFWIIIPIKLLRRKSKK